MLSTTRTSRAQLVTGVAAVGLLTIAGLGLTASGTQAAETIRSRVSETIGVTLPAAVAPAAPVAPTAVQVSDLPPPPPIATNEIGAPPAPPAPPAVALGTASRVRVVQDGQLVQDTISGAMPEVSSADCPGSGPTQMVIHDNSGGRNRLLICTNRIAEAAARGAEMAANSAEIERNAYQAALSSLRSARSSVAANGSIKADEKREALAAIEDSIAELEDDLAGVGTDD